MGSTVHLTSTAPGTPVNVVGGVGTNTLVGSAAPNSWTITGTNKGSITSPLLAGFVSFSAMTHLTGGSDNDTFVFKNGQGVSGNVQGGGGTNTLDFSAHTSRVAVTLRTGFGTGVGFLADIQSVIGGNAGPSGSYNLLVGNGGDTLIGGNGRRNILIAGSSSSVLYGGDGDDLLIGGGTNHDSYSTNLSAIVAEWTRTDKSYSQRIVNLTSGGGLNGGFMLNSSTVFGNGGGNTLFGQTGLDLFFGNLALDNYNWNVTNETFIEV